MITCFCIFLIAFISKEASTVLRDGVTEFYDSVDGPVHMIVSGSVLVTDEPRHARSYIPHAPDIKIRNTRSYEPRVFYRKHRKRHHASMLNDHKPGYVSEGIGFIYNDVDPAGDEAIYFFPKYAIKKSGQKNFSKHHTHHKQQRKRKHRRHKAKEVKGNARNQIPEEKHVEATRKSIYPPPSNMWLINQELTTTEEILRENGKLTGKTLNPLKQDNFKLHPEVESFDVTMNFRTKEGVPKSRNMHNKMPSPIIHLPIHRNENHRLTQVKTSDLIDSAVDSSVDDHETISMFNKGHSLFKSKEDVDQKPLKGTEEFREKIDELKERVDLLKSNAEDNKVTDTFVTHGGTHTLNGVPQKQTQDDQTDDGTHTVNGVPMKQFKSTPSLENEPAIVQQADQKEKFTSSDSSQQVLSNEREMENLNSAPQNAPTRAVPDQEDYLTSKQNKFSSKSKQDFASKLYNTLTTHANKQKIKDNLLAKSDNGDEKQTYPSHFRPTTPIDRNTNDEASYANTFQEKLLKLYSPEAFTEEEERYLSHQTPPKALSRKQNENLKFGESSVKEGGILLHGEEKENHFKPHTKELVIQTKLLGDTTGNRVAAALEPLQSSEQTVPFEHAKQEPLSRIQQLNNGSEEDVENPAGYTPEQRATTGKNENIGKENKVKNSKQHPIGPLSFKDQLTQKIKENLLNINPKDASAKAKKIAHEAITSHKPASLHKSEKEHPVIYPRPSFSEFRKKLHDQSGTKEHLDLASTTKDGRNEGNSENSHEVHMMSLHNNYKDDNDAGADSDSDGIDTKTEKPVSARKDPEEDQMTITADPSHEELKSEQESKSEKESEKYLMNDTTQPETANEVKRLKFHHTSDKTDQHNEDTQEKLSISNKNIVDKQRAVEYIMYRNNLNQRLTPEHTSKVQQQQIEQQVEQLPPTTNAGILPVQSTDSTEYQNSSPVEASGNNSTSDEATDSEYVDSAQKAQLNTSSTATLTQTVPYDNSLPSDQSTTTAKAMEPNSFETTTAEVPNSTEFSVRETNAEVNPSETVATGDSIAAGIKEESAGTVASETTGNTMNDQLELSNGDSVTAPLDFAINANAVSYSPPAADGSAPIPEIAISAPQDITAKSLTTEVPNSKPSSILKNNYMNGDVVLPYVSQAGNDETEHNELDLSVNAATEYEPKGALDIALSSTQPNNNDIWPSGVNPGALMSFQMAPQQIIQHESGTYRANVKNERPTYNQQMLHEQENQKYIPIPNKLFKSNNIMSILKPRRPTGPSIAYDQELTGVTREVYTSSKSISKSKASASSSSASNANAGTNTATNYNSVTDGYNQARTQTVATTRHHEKKPKTDYGYGSGSGYGYGTKSWGWGGGGGWSGSSPPKGIPVNIPQGPPPNLPGFPDGNQKPSTTNANQASQANGVKPYVPSQTDVKITYNNGASHTPQANKPPTSTQNHQSSVAVGPNSVPPNYTNKIKPLGGLKDLKFGKLKVNKIKTTGFKVEQHKQKMRKIHKQITYESKKIPVSQVPSQEKPVQMSLRPAPDQSIHVDVTPENLDPLISKPVTIKKPKGPKSNFPEDNDK